MNYPREVERIADTIRQIKADTPWEAALAEAKEWGDWDVIIAAAGDKHHPKYERAQELCGQAIGLPAAIDEMEAEDA